MNVSGVSNERAEEAASFKVNRNSLEEEGGSECSEEDLFRRGPRNQT